MSALWFDYFAPEYMVREIVDRGSYESHRFIVIGTTRDGRGFRWELPDLHEAWYDVRNATITRTAEAERESPCDVREILIPLRRDGRRWRLADIAQAQRDCLERAHQTQARRNARVAKVTVEQAEADQARRAKLAG